MSACGVIGGAARGTQGLALSVGAAIGAVEPITGRATGPADPTLMPPIMGCGMGPADALMGMGMGAGVVTLIIIIGCPDPIIGCCRDMCSYDDAPTYGDVSDDAPTYGDVSDDAPAYGDAPT